LCFNCIFFFKLLHFPSIIKTSSLYLLFFFHHCNFLFCDIVCNFQLSFFVFMFMLLSFNTFVFTLMCWCFMFLCIVFMRLLLIICNLHFLCDFFFGGNYYFILILFYFLIATKLVTFNFQLFFGSHSCSLKLFLFTHWCIIFPCILFTLLLTTFCSPCIFL
jgi:hypothetical protein